MVRRSGRVAVPPLPPLAFRTSRTRMRTAPRPAGHSMAIERPTSEIVAPRMAVRSEKILRCTAMGTLGEMASWATRQPVMSSAGGAAVQAVSGPTRAGGVHARLGAAGRDVPN